MTVYSARQLVDIARQGGFLTPNVTAIAVAIALAESGGNSLATHKNTNGSTDYGLWQINSIHKDLFTYNNWKDPNGNANMAYTVYANAGRRFTPWTTYTSGRYLAFLSVARSAVQAAGGVPADQTFALPGGGTGTNAPATGAGQSGAAASGGAASQQGAQQTGLSLPNPLAPLDAFAKMAELLTNPSTYLRIGMFVGGWLLLYWGIRDTTWSKNVTAAGKRVGTQIGMAVATDGGSLAAAKGLAK